MSIGLEKPQAPPDDRRYRMIDATMRRNGYEPQALIETLHTVQETFGFIDEKALVYAARSLRVPLSQAYGVATFYHFFNLKPPGEHTCTVCTGTACYIKGVPGLLQAIDEVAHVKAGETTPDGKVSLLAARCLGACGLAPVAVFDGEVVGMLTPEQVRQRVAAWVTP
jgi:bidirectional [NiFe] hydrogenase diaphorase subunit